MSKPAIVIPVLEPSYRLVDYVRGLFTRGFQKVIIVNDGSGPAFEPVFDQLRAFDGCTVLVHDRNRGKGRALKTAFEEYIRQGWYNDYCGVITADGDGQHTLADVVKISRVMELRPDALILGERDLKNGVPVKSRIGNGASAFMYRVLFRTKLRDSQTGLRGIPNHLLSPLSTLAGERYEYEMNMLMYCTTHRHPMVGTRISTVYYDYNQNSHFKPFKDTVRLHFMMFRTKMKNL